MKNFNFILNLTLILIPSLSFAEGTVDLKKLREKARKESIIQKFKTNAFDSLTLINSDPKMKEFKKNATEFATKINSKIPEKFKKPIINFSNESNAFGLKYAALSAGKKTHRWFDPVFLCRQTDEQLEERFDMLLRRLITDNFNKNASLSLLPINSVGLGASLFSARLKRI